MNPDSCQVAVIGGGPSGLAVATELRDQGVERVVVIEREVDAGGIPRHCGHSPFGMREFRRVLFGPEYARRLVDKALKSGVELRCATDVAAIGADLELELASDTGRSHLLPERLVLCTGNREKPRSARLVSGTRPAGIVTTGALQSMAYLKHKLPFRRPVIVGSELVAFSALLTCRHFGIRPVAMLEAGPDTVARWPAAWLPRALGLRLLKNTSLVAVRGRERVSGVETESTDGTLQQLECDGVVFCGDFVAEASLLQNSHIELDPASGGPSVDQYGRCTDSRIFACGNLLHPVDTAGWCWQEGRRLARWVRASLTGDLPAPGRSLDIQTASPWLKYFTPQRVSLDQNLASTTDIQVRFNKNRRGILSLQGAGGTLTERRVNGKRERRVLLPLPERLPDSGRLLLDFQPD